MKNLSALFGGLVFGAGLAVSGMTDPEKVLGFLTLDANWDPALVYVLGSAVSVAALGFWLVRERVAPLFDADFHAPSSNVLDARLLGGAAVFGVGWGLVGFCPGPALVGAMTLDPRAVVFLGGFVVGLIGYEKLLTPGALPARTADG